MRQGAATSEAVQSVETGVEKQGVETGVKKTGVGDEERRGGQEDVEVLDEGPGSAERDAEEEATDRTATLPPPPDESEAAPERVVANIRCPHEPCTYSGSLQGFITHSKTQCDRCAVGRHNRPVTAECCA